MTQWIFFDVGNVLVNDDPQNFESYRVVFERIREFQRDYTFAAMLAEREEMAGRGALFILRQIAQRLLPPDDFQTTLKAVHDYLTETYDQHNVINEGAGEVLEALCSRYRLGVIANQSVECRKSLKRRGLLEFFQVVAISDELDLYKPDVRLYEWALSHAAVEPHDSVMIGDRRDNDIVPANELSMRTVLVRWPSCRSKGWNPEDPLAQLFLDSCDRVPLFSAVPVGPEPDRTVSSLKEIPAAIDSLE